MDEVDKRKLKNQCVVCGKKADFTQLTTTTYYTFCKKHNQDADIYELEGTRIGELMQEKTRMCECKNCKHQKNKHNFMGTCFSLGCLCSKFLQENVK